METKVRDSENNIDKRINSNKDDYLSIPEFYSDKCVFITGASGFLGKVLVEKLLRSCPQIKSVYLLMRPKKEVKLQERLNNILKAPLFNKIREKQPDMLDKVIAIAGDIKYPQLGISEQDQKMLTENVAVVFHVAATVRFDEKIREAVDINVKGTQRIMDLSRRMTNLKAFLYVSTAYSNCDRKEVNETFYDIPFNSEAIINVTENFPDDFLDKCTQLLIGKRPNTYTFTKAIAEDVISRETAFPVVVVRPSIVTSTMTEPFSGWTDSIFGPTAIVAANSKGIYHTMICDPHNIVDVVPADLVINVLIAAAWKAGKTKSKEKLIYNVTTSIKNPISWNEFCGDMFKIIRSYPFEGALWYPTRHITKNKIVHKVYAAFAHYLPAYIIDAVSRLSGQKPVLVKIHNKLAAASESLEFFKLNEIKFYGNNVDKLLDSMSENDALNFPVDVTNINWKDYLFDYTLGIRQYVFKQDLSSLDDCRKRMLKLKILHYTLKTVFMFFMLKLVLFDFNVYEYILKLMFMLVPDV